jgi:DNA recombination-dependent growth factor C
MGAFEGGLTYRRYYVREPLPEGWRDRFQGRIAHHAFKEIPVESEEERAIGWCSPRFALDVELYPEHYLFNDYLALGLRIDTLKVPGPLLKLFTQNESRRVMMEQKRESLTRYEQAEIKEKVRKELRKRLVPSIKTVDMVWHLDSGIVRFWSTSEKLNLEFQELFEQTFDVLPIPDGAYTGAAYGGLGLSDEQVEKLLDLEPAIFADAEALARESN